MQAGVGAARLILHSDNVSPFIVFMKEVCESKNNIVHTDNIFKELLGVKMTEWSCTVLKKNSK